jgi:hypothetical protein
MHGVPFDPQENRTSGKSFRPGRSGATKGNYSLLILECKSRQEFFPGQEKEEKEEKEGGG